MEIITSAFEYEQLEEIGAGQGQNSKVYRAHLKELGGEVAVKEIPKSSFGGPSEYFEEARAMFRSDCPNVLPIRVASAAGDRICLVMPFMKNGSLQDRINHGPISVKETIRIGQGILAGIHQIHVAGTIHFDIKPSNVLFSDIDDPLVADFGQSRAVLSSGVVAVPPMYILARPPEAILYRHADRQSDIYQAGWTLYRSLMGDPLFNEQVQAFSSRADIENAIVQEKFPRRHGYLPHIPTWIPRVLNKAMHTDLSERYQSADRFAHELGLPDVVLDWKPAYQTNGELEWVADRPNKSPLTVKLLREGSSNKWRVETFTGSQSNSLRAMRNHEGWKRDMTMKEAFTHLRQFFRSQEQA